MNIWQIAAIYKIPALDAALMRLDAGDKEGAKFKIQLDWDKLAGTPSIEKAILEAGLADDGFAEYLRIRAYGR